MPTSIQPKVTRVGGRCNVFSLFKHLSERLEPRFSFLLESLSEHKPLYSFLCFNPDYILTVKKDRPRVEEILTERGEQILRRLQPQRKMPSAAHRAVEDRVENRILALDRVEEYFPETALRRPPFFRRQVFFGGYLGYVAYDAVAPWVGFKRRAETPEVMLGMHTTVLIYDHAREILLQVDNGVGGAGDVSQDLGKALKSYRAEGGRKDDVSGDISVEDFKSNVGQEEFSHMVEQCKEYIWSGDIFQVVVSRKVGRKTEAGDLAIYEALRRLNPSPYMFYLNFGSLRFVGSSPEALVSLNREKITTVPIAGTRRRGWNKVDEGRMLRELKTDSKERAEHVMLVDLARNDVSKVSEPGSVQVRGFMTVKRFKHVMHLVTTVEGRLRRGMNSFDVLKCLFPAGTVTGAPKLRAMEVIEELEKEPRGPYAGAIGYMAFNGDMDWAITIRTIQLLNSTATVQAGAGVVADSQPRLEWIETENKMRSLVKAVGMAEAKVNVA
ncbi:anthranilate synthase component I family protein [Candidatus Hecatella orcuttiae]|jgi:anthranilate synthase component 1|uniref:anthranilate synthase component I family protein n=1 Tax=Candidatus Hecatella orcuttiae TaxID=1935119 RepID=UPI002867E2B5|nr:anthranilate synthase component I family protein [Candidatus Hecatella orcuttiae]